MPTGRFAMHHAWSVAVLAGALACGPESDEGQEGPSDYELEVADACNPACDVELECTGRCPVECLPACYDMIDWRMPPRPPCDTARLELAACQGTLDCDEFEALVMGLANPCAAEAADVEAQCD